MKKIWALVFGLALALPRLAVGQEVEFSFQAEVERTRPHVNVVLPPGDTVVKEPIHFQSSSDELRSLRITGSGNSRLVFQLPPDAPFAMAVIGFSNSEVIFEDWTLRCLSRPVVGLLGGRSPATTGTPGRSANSWRFRNWQIEGNFYGASMFGCGVEIPVFDYCGFRNNEPLSEKGPAYVIAWSDANTWGFPNGTTDAPIFHDDPAVTCAVADFRSCTISQYSLNPGFAMIGLGTKVHSFNWTSGCTGSSSRAPFMHIYGAGCFNININSDLEGANKPYIVRVDAPVVDLNITGGVMQAYIAVLRLNANASGRIEPARSYRAPTAVHRLPTAIWSGTKYGLDRVD